MKNDRVARIPATPARQSQPASRPHDTTEDALPAVAVTHLKPQPTRPQPASVFAQLLNNNDSRHPSSASTLLQLQRQYGNRYVQRVVQLARARSVVQAKLAVTPAKDIYEQEADRVAQQVRQSLQAPPALAHVDDEAPQAPVAVAAAPQHMLLTPLQRRPWDGLPGTTVGPEVEANLQQARVGGSALPAPMRKPMERALGADFSGVRLHTDAAAHALNQLLHARAFTSGQDIFLGQGEYNPSSPGGQEVLAHELTHVVQQRRGSLLSPSRIQRVSYGRKHGLSDSYNTHHNRVFQKKVEALSARGTTRDYGELWQLYELLTDDIKRGKTAHNEEWALRLLKKNLFPTKKEDPDFTPQTEKNLEEEERRDRTASAREAENKIKALKKQQTALKKSRKRKREDLAETEEKIADETYNLAQSREVNEQESRVKKRKAAPGVFLALITFNFEKFGRSTIRKDSELAQKKLDAVGKVVEAFSPTILAFQEITDVNLFLEGYKGRKYKVVGVKDLDLTNLYFEQTEGNQEEWEKELAEDRESGKSLIDPSKLQVKLSEAYGVSKGPLFESESGGNPESYPVIYDTAKVLGRPEYYTWNGRKLQRATGPLSINLKEQKARPVVYAKINLNTSEFTFRPLQRKIPTTAVYIGIVHTSPSKKGFSTYVQGIGEEYKQVKDYVEKNNLGTALLLGDFYAEEGAKTFLKNEKAYGGRNLLPEFPSNIDPYGNLQQRADQFLIPSSGVSVVQSPTNLLPTAETSVEDVLAAYRERQTATGKHLAQLQKKEEEEIGTWRDIKIDHTPVLVSVEVVLDEQGALTLRTS